MKDLPKPGAAPSSARHEKRPSAQDAAIYVLEFRSGIIKVGFTRSPARRLKQHNAAARRFNDEIVREWVSPWHYEAVANERALMAFCSVQMGAAALTPETFSGISFDGVVTHAKSLPFNYASAEQIANAQQRLDDVREALFGSVVDVKGQQLDDGSGEFVADSNFWAAIGIAEIFQQGLIEAGMESQLFEVNPGLMGKSLMVFTIGFFLSEKSLGDRLFIAHDVMDCLASGGRHSVLDLYDRAMEYLQACVARGGKAPAAEKMSPRAGVHSETALHQLH